MLGHLQGLDIFRAITNRTRPFSLSSQLFVAISGTSTCQAISSQRILKWITQCIYICYQMAREPLPLVIKAHSTSVQAASSDCFSNIPVSEICKTNTWSNPLTSIKHYAWDMEARSDAKFGKIVFNHCLIQQKCLTPTIQEGYCLLVISSEIHIEMYSNKKELLLTL